MYPNSKLALADEAATLGYLRNIVLIPLRTPINIQSKVWQKECNKRIQRNRYAHGNSGKYKKWIRNESEISEKEYPASSTIVGIEKENCHPGRKIRPGVPGKVGDRSSGGTFIGLRSVGPHQMEMLWARSDQHLWNWLWLGEVGTIHLTHQSTVWGRSLSWFPFRYGYCVIRS